MMPALIAMAMLGSAPAEPAAVHQFDLYFRSGVSAFMSETRTQGGIGGGVGLRDTVQERWLFQAEVSGLAALGRVLDVRVGAGVQRRGTWTPAALVHVGALLGDRLRFPTPQSPIVADGPALSAGVTLMPARFTFEGAKLSLLGLSMGVGPDTGGPGVFMGLTLIEVGISL